MKKDKTKLYIPLLNVNGSITLLNARKVNSLTELIPQTRSIQENLLAWSINKDKFGTEYQPLMVSVNGGKWQELEREINSKQPKNKFVKKAFDLVSDTSQGLPLVTIIKE